MSRDNLLEQAEKLMNEVASNKAILEIHYEDEVKLINTSPGIYLEGGEH